VPIGHCRIGVDKMIDNIYWAWYWALSGVSFSRTLTIGIPDRTVLAQTSLARVARSGSAEAFIKRLVISLHMTRFYMASPQTQTVWSGIFDKKRRLI
jgi:hypothetical protein